MAPHKPQKREYSAAELAMLDDIGAGRVDELPLEDKGTIPRDGSAMNSIESGRTGTKNTWNTAIARGDFEDDDAAFVAGQGVLANGQLARMRRAADLSYMAVNRNFGYNDRRLSQNRNGQVVPRARFSRGERGPARAGLTHTGDGPVALRGAMRNSRHQPHVPNKTSSPSSPAARRLDKAPALQPVGVPTQSSGPQDEVRVQSTTVAFQLPNGHTIFFQAHVTFASPTFINRTGEYPGTIYLVNGPSTADDQIILHVDEDRVEDVKRRTKEYVDYLSDSDRIILQFKDGSGCITWFVVIFRQRDIMVSFVDALRTFVDRLRKPSPSQDSTCIDPLPVDNPAVSIEPLRNTSASVVRIPQQQDATKTISVAILEDIVSWAMHIVAFIRDAGPAELANADALPGIIRGASAAVLMEKHAGFSGLDSKERVAFVDEVCVPQVFERFKRRMRPTEAVSTLAPSAHTSLDMQEITDTEHRRPTYTIEQLMQLEAKAIDPPAWLPELRYLPEISPDNRLRIKALIQRDCGLHSVSTSQAARAPERAIQQTIRVDSPKSESGLSGSVLPNSAREAGSRRTDTLATESAPAPSSAPSITVTAPSGTSKLEEPLVTIHGEMNGLNSSRHNMNGVDMLGQSAGQFTGVLSRDKSHLEDLMLLDGLEDFEVIRAHDPEVAEIADRFARVNFGEGRSS